MGQEELGHKEFFTDPLPPSGNRDKLYFSRGDAKLSTSGKVQVNYFITYMIYKLFILQGLKIAKNCVETETQK